MTRWVAQTHNNFVSLTPYNWTATEVHGFQGTRQPAIWMGENGPVVVVPGFTSSDKVTLKTLFDDRGLNMRKETEKITPAYYSIVLNDGVGGGVLVEQSATSRVGHLRFTFNSSFTPYILVESSRQSVFTASATPTPANITFPNGTVSVNLVPGSSQVHEICGSNSERQDAILTPLSTRPFVAGFNGYYCARFDYTTSTTSYGTVQNSTMHPLAQSGEGALLLGYAVFEPQSVVNVRVGTSLISIDQARKNIDAEVPDGTTLEQTVSVTKAAWTDKVGRFALEGGSVVQQQTFWTGVAHAMQYPYEVDEQGSYYSGYDGKIHQGDSYTGYSIWDVYRAEWAFLILFAPERLPGMVMSMLHDFEEGGRLPMWKNIVETNIMVGTHADSLIAEAVVKGVQGFNTELAWEAVWKDATVPPINDTTIVNEVLPSHHIPYLYALAGAASKTQERVRQIAQANYNNTPNGLSGNEDCGQMSAWYLFSAMGFYPVNPVSGEYVVGSPFFDKITIDLPPTPQQKDKTQKRTLSITALGAQTMPYVKSLTVNGRKVDSPIIRHEDIANGGELVFEMSGVVEEWGNETLVRLIQRKGFVTLTLSSNAEVGNRITFGQAGAMLYAFVFHDQIMTYNI
ncbi:hypothetical protein C0991_010551 [Blastosporella zonata]|nr:hypothetical protein C0991_010551 [Blastosporella zonata]